MPHHRPTLSLLWLAICLSLLSGTAQAEDTPTFKMVVDQNGFSPAQITIPVGQTVKLMVQNRSALPAEFESNDFSCEKVIPGKSTVPVYVGPLKPGTYRFYNDFSPGKTGKLIVKSQGQ